MAIKLKPKGESALGGAVFDPVAEGSDSNDNFVEHEGAAEASEGGLKIGVGKSEKNLSLQLISNILDRSSVKDLHTYTPPREALSIGDQELFNTLSDYCGKYGQLPTEPDFREFAEDAGIEFPGLPAPNPEQGHGYLYDKLLENAQDSKLTGYIQKALIGRNEGLKPLERTRGLLDDLTKVLRLDPEVAKADPVAQAVNVSIRHRQKLLLKSAQGIPFGLDTFDTETGGFVPNTVNIIAARPSVGKTFLALKAARSGYHAGKRVKVISMEMTEDQLWDRFFAMEAGIEPNRISKFGLSTNESKKLKAAIDQFKIDLDSGEKYIDMKHPNGKYTPLDIYNECVRDETEFLILDAAYLIQHENDFLNTKTWDKIREVINEIKLKIASPLSIPVIATYQLIDEVDKYTDHDKITLGDLYGGDTMAQIASTVMALWQDPAKADHRLYMKFLKGRDGEANLRGIWINWIFKTMLFDEWKETEDFEDVQL
ncbi:DnaB-like DNA helicase [Vibrio phage 1.215.B._10N.222.54.F7]|nr:DnaB-like DNA helicase [Vibrio phage 1.215.A._10N.222.54.F7]AUR96114.1 DnaB-like DNA helicase [Vibrio phage 1.215.B._10N.222.54.F7]